MRTIWLFVISVIIGSVQAGGQVKSNVVVFKIPAEIETYTPITSDNIEKSAFTVVYVRDDKQASKVIDLIEQTTQAFNPKRIRVKISRGKMFYVFDSDGIGMASSGQAVKLDLKALKLVLCE